MSLTKLTYVAAKRQSSDNVAVVPTHFFRYKEGDVLSNQENIMNNPIENSRWGARTAVKGKQDNEINFKSDFDPNETPFWISAGCGGLSSSDVSSGTDTSVYQHTITVSNTIPDLTIEQSYGDITDTSNNRLNYQIKRAVGAKIDEWSLKSADNIVEFNVKAKSLAILEHGRLIDDLGSTGSPVTIAVEQVEGFVASETVSIYDDTPQNETRTISSISLANKTITFAGATNSYTRANNARIYLTPLSPSFSLDHMPFAFHTAQIQFGTTVSAAASASADNIEDWEFTFKNNLETKPGTLRPGYSVMKPKEAEAMFKFTKYFENVQDWYRYKNNVKRGCILTLTNRVRVSETDTAALKYQMKINMYNVQFKSFDMPTGNAALHYYTIEGTLLYSTSDSKAMNIICQNAVAGTAYTA